MGIAGVHLVVNKCCIIPFQQSIGSQNFLFNPFRHAVLKIWTTKEELEESAKKEDTNSKTQSTTTIGQSINF